jgi:hypothetical protein
MERETEIGMAPRRAMRRGARERGPEAKKHARASPRSGREAHPIRLSMLLLAESAKSQGFGDSVPNLGSARHDKGKAAPCVE